MYNLGLCVHKLCVETGSGKLSLTSCNKCTASLWPKHIQYSTPFGDKMETVEEASHSSPFETLTVAFVASRLS